MVKKILAALFLLLSVSLALSAQTSPREAAFTGRELNAEGFDIVSHCQELVPAVGYLSSYLGESRGGGVKVELSLACTGVSEREGYELAIDDDGVHISGVDYAGVFNGIQQFLRLLPPSVYGTKGITYPVSVPMCSIRDWPEYHCRGVMLDVARTWVPVDQIYRLVDNISHFNLNVLHLHLCDNEAWRVEILAYPQLAQLGGFRSPDGVIKPIYGKYDETFGGYYTQQQLRDLVAYAAQRNVEIVPEIDLPGHSRAIGAVMPEILCDWQPDTAKTAGVDFRDVWCVSKESNYEIITRILTEICGIFPSEYLHIGGDEVGMHNWLSCPGCQAKMQEMDFTDAHQLEDMFMRRVTGIVKNLGRTPLAWWDEDVIKDNFPSGSVVYGWQSFKSCVNAIDKGHRTVLVPAHYCYLDMHQRPWEVGNIWAGAVDYDKVLSLGEEMDSLTDEQKSKVEGVLGAFWAETCTSNNPETTDYQDLMLFPRLLAIASLGWNGHNANASLDSSYAAMDSMGIKYWRETPDKRSGEKIRPAVKITSSLDEDTSKPFSVAASYEGVSYTGRSPIKGDWVLYEFESPVSCSRIELKTGYVEFPSAVIASGYASISYDGVHFKPAGRLYNGAVTIKPGRKVRAVRVESDRKGNGFYMLVIQPLEIFK